MSMTSLSSKLYTMQGTSPLPKLNSSPSDAALTKPLTFKKSLSSQILFMPQKESLIPPFICTRYIRHPFQTNSENFSSSVVAIWSNFGNVQVSVVGCSIKRWIEKQNNSTVHHYFLANHSGILARRVSATTLLRTGRWHSKHRIWRDAISLILSTMMIILSNHHMQMADHGSSILGIPILCAQEQWEL